MVAPAVLAASVAPRGKPEKEAPQAHAKKEAQEDAAKDAPPAQVVVARLLSARFALPIGRSKPV
jgi:hypothetical protein